MRRVLVVGSPGSGKTTLGRRIADDLRFPFLNKDGIKESLFDNLGWSDREWSKRLGVASYAILYDQIEAHLRVGAPLVVAGAVCRRWQREQLPEAIRELVLDDQRLRNGICRQRNGGMHLRLRRKRALL